MISLGILWHCSVSLTVKKIVFSDVLVEHSVFQFVTVDSHPVIGNYGKEPFFITFAPTLQVFIFIDEISSETPL